MLVHSLHHGINPNLALCQFTWDLIDDKEAYVYLLLDAFWVTKIPVQHYGLARLGCSQ
jgi:hypothetical protein